jgi:hypothetical protein
VDCRTAPRIRTHPPWLHHGCCRSYGLRARSSGSRRNSPWPSYPTRPPVGPCCRRCRAHAAVVGTPRPGERLLDVPFRILHPLAWHVGVQSQITRLSPPGLSPVRTDTLNNDSGPSEGDFQRGCNWQQIGFLVPVDRPHFHGVAEKRQHNFVPCMIEVFEVCVPARALA